MIIGAHISIAKGLKAAVRTAIEMQANTLQFFTRNPRGGSARALNLLDIEEAQVLLKQHHFGPLVAHAPYTCNLASVKPGVRAFSQRILQEDMVRVKEMGASYLVLHSGTHGGQGLDQGTQFIVEALQGLLETIPEGVTLLLEVMAGEGSEIGYTFEQLAAIIAGCEKHPQMGVCLDSCHLTGAGYDLRDFSAVKQEFQEVIGWERLKAFHLNDTLHVLGSKRDRHARLGEGQLGLEVIKSIVCDCQMQEIPLILETPNDDVGYAREIELVKKMCGSLADFD